MTLNANSGVLYANNTKIVIMIIPFMAIMQHKLITLVIGVKLQQAQQFVTHD